MLTGNEQRAAEAVRLEARARRKEANRARYVRRMKRIYRDWGLAATRADNLARRIASFNSIVERLA